MGMPVNTIASGGLAVTEAVSGFGTPIEEAPAGFGTGVTYVASGGMPVVSMTAIAQGDFVANTYSQAGQPVQQATALGFSRDSTGTYLDATGTMQTAAVDALRIDHDPVSHAVLGALIEATATNLTLHSEDLSAWGGTSAATVSVNVVVAPDGNTTADKLVETTASTAHFVDTPNVAMSAGPADVSIYAEAGERTLVEMYVVDSTGIVAGSPTQFNLATGAVVSGAGGKIENAGNGWYRLTVSTTVAAGNVKGRVLLNAGAGYVGDGVSGTFFWGLQIATAHSSYIPTTAAAASRVADALTINAVGTNNWTLTFDDGSTQLFPGVSGNFTIDPTLINRPHISSYRAARAA